jgi:hypothetical protein
MDYSLDTNDQIASVVWDPPEICNSKLMEMERNYIQISLTGATDCVDFNILQKLPYL